MTFFEKKWGNQEHGNNRLTRTILQALRRRGGVCVYVCVCVCVCVCVFTVVDDVCACACVCTGVCV